MPAPSERSPSADVAAEFLRAGSASVNEVVFRERFDSARQSIHGAIAIERARYVAADAARRAGDHDDDGAFPHEDIAALHHAGLLMAPFPIDRGGEGLGIGDADRLRGVLTAIGRGSLPLGRLYEGHVNAVVLTVRYGSHANLKLLQEEALAGRPTGVWMGGETLRLERGTADDLVLRGGKILCSGATHLRRPLVAAEHDGGSIMILPLVAQGERAEADSWTAQGMRATATDSVDFDGITVAADELVGTTGDYLRSPFFRGGAWRVLAVQLGGVEALLRDMRRAIARESESRPAATARALRRGGNRLRDGASLVEKASRVGEGSGEDAEAIDAYVDLARNAFEATALKVVALAQKSIGLKAFLRPNPLERLSRDLTIYLRQPNLDMSLMSAAAFRLRTRETI